MDLFTIAEMLADLARRVGALERKEYPLLEPYGSFSDSTTQAIANATQAQAVTLNTDEHKYRMTHSTVTNPSRVQIDVAGVYEITISAVADLSVGTNQTLNMWLAVDGSNIATSNTIVNILSTAQQILGVSMMHNFTAGQYFEIMMSGSSTAVQILATAAGVSPTRPACPSIIITVVRVSEGA